ncbi:MAG: hypothetical protein SO401_10535 [Blautia sp.]|nr:hypothetical protein [Clostridia bacterium]MDY4693956.1 hypothetical protein [Blautia sp.]MDY5555680.1 hypothetical protein [Blautia sp.]
MDLFETRRAKIKKIFLSLLPFVFIVCVCLAFYLGINSTDKDVTAKEQITLEQALHKGAIRTYALTGRYPGSLDEILSDYHISYNPDKFIVEYIPNGSNLLPSISVLIKNQRKE